jgi:thiol-disulfide isomerase/thioredoxin/tetratricopeptide (TPR) repeat protein
MVEQEIRSEPLAKARYPRDIRPLVGPAFPPVPDRPKAGPASIGVPFRLSTLLTILLAFTLRLATAQDAFVNAGLRMSAAEAETAEQSLITAPDDIQTRSSLIVFYYRQGVRVLGADRIDKIKDARRRHILWVIEYRPEAAVAGLPDFTIDPAGHTLADAEGYQQARTLWFKQLARTDLSSPALTNAALFFRTPDPATALNAARRAFALAPASTRVVRILGLVAAYAVCGVSAADSDGFATAIDSTRVTQPAAADARAVLASATAPALLEMAVTVDLGLPISMKGRKLPCEPLADADTLSKRWVDRHPDDPRAWRTRYAVMRDLIASGSPADPRALWKQAFDALERSHTLSKVALDESTLEDLARAAFEAGEFEKSEHYATELLHGGADPTGPNYGEVVHDENCLLGRIALRRNDPGKAAAYLHEAGLSMGSPRLNSFGPDLTLARELAEVGQREPVIAYLKLVRRFWRSDQGLLAFWIQTLQSGTVPTFHKGAAAVEESKSVDLRGKPLPEFPAMVSLAGAKVNLKDYAGKVVLLDFWATWCIPCRTQMPAIDRFWRRHQSDGLVVMGMNAAEDETEVRRWLGLHPVSYPILMANEDLLRTLGLHSYPTAIWIGKDGKVAVLDVGSGLESELEQRWQSIARAASARK